MLHLPKILSAALACTALAWPSGAVAYDGKFVRAACLADKQETVALCVGYATGLGQALILATRWSKTGLPTPFCAPDDYQPKDTAAVMLEYMDAHPDEEGWDGAALALAALADKFPCD